jgi:hypothetical protein
MARSIATIKQQMIDTKATLSALSDLTSDSQVSIFGNVFHVTATQIGVLEQLIDLYIEEIETIINAQAVGSIPWLRAKILEFQNGDYVELNTSTFAIAYPEIDEALKIITRCSVKETGNLVVQAKVAKSDPPVALSGLEITALEDYLDIIKPAGTQINVVSLTADKLYIFGTVFYSGQYSDVISDNVEAALNDYMTNLSSAENFDGIVRVIEIIDAIQAVEGVVDVNITEVGCRADTVAFASRTVVYKLSTGTNLREYTTVSGYIVEETESGSEFANTLTYTSV